VQLCWLWCVVLCCMMLSHARFLGCVDKVELCSCVAVLG
jgi:hypothetical protein